MATDIKQKVLYELQVNGVDKASGDMKELEGASGGVASSFAGIPPQAALVAAAVAAAAAAVVVLTKAAIDNTNAMSTQGAALFNNASAANVTVEEYQALNYVLRQTTGQLNGAEKQYRAINTFLLSATSATSLQGKALAELNLEYDAVFAMDPQARYMEITNAIGQLTDKTQQNVIAAGIFGSRYSSQVVAALNQADGSMRGMMDTFRESNLILSTETVTAMKKYDDAVTDFQIGMDVLKGDLAVGMIPILEELMIGFQDVLPVLREGVAKAMPIVTEKGLELVEMGMTAIPMLVDLVEGFANAAEDVDEFYESLEPTLIALGDLVGWLIEVDQSLRDIAFGSLIDGLEDTFGILIDIVEFAQKHETTMRVAMAVVSSGMSEVTRTYEENREAIHALERAEERRSEATRAVIEEVEAMYAAQVLSNEATRQAARDARTVSDELFGLSAKTDDLTQEMIDLEYIEIKVAWGALAVNAALKGMTPAIAAQMETLRVYRAELGELGTGLAGVAGAAGSQAGAAAPTPPPRPVVTGADPFAILGFGSLGDVESTYQEITMIAVNEEELKQEAIASIQADWREQYYDTYMQFSGDVVNTFVGSWENGFKDLDDMMKDMIARWMKEMVASGILSLFSQAAGGGAVGLFGSLLGKASGGGK